MLDSVTPATLVVPASLNPQGMPSFIQMEQHEEDKKAAEAFVKGVSKKDKDGFAGLIPKAFLAEANEADASAKLTSTSSEMGKYLATLGAKVALEEGFAKAISSATSYGAMQAAFASGWGSSNNEISSAANAVEGSLNQKDGVSYSDNSNWASDLAAEHQNFFQSAGNTGTFIGAIAQANRTIKNALDKMVSQMQGEAGTVSSIVSSLYNQGS